MTFDLRGDTHPEPEHFEGDAWAWVWEQDPKKPFGEDDLANSIGLLLKTLYYAMVDPSPENLSAYEEELNEFLVDADMEDVAEALTQGFTAILNLANGDNDNRKDGNSNG